MKSSIFFVFSRFLKSSVKKKSYRLLARMGLPSFFTLLTYVSGYVVIVFLVVCLACGLCDMADFAEEHTALTRKFLTWSIRVVVGIHLLLMLFDGFPPHWILLSAASHGLYYSLIRTFPFVTFSSPAFIGSCLAVVLNHVWWIIYFRSRFLTVLQVMGFFVPCVWLVPFTLLVSVSVNDSVLPGVNAPSSGVIDSDSGIASKGRNVFKTLFAFSKAKIDALFNRHAPAAIQQEFLRQDLSKKGF